MERRGQLFAEMLIAGIVLFVLAIVIVVMTFTTGKVNDAVQASNIFNEDGKAVLEDVSDDYASTWDNGFIFFFGGLWVFFIISTFYLDSHPIFFIVMMIAMIAVFVVLMVLGNTFISFVSGGGDIAAAAENLPMTVWLISHILEVFILMFFTCIITLYAKPSRGGGV